MPHLPHSARRRLLLGLLHPGFPGPLILGPGSSQAQSHRIRNLPLLKRLSLWNSDICPPSWILLSLIRLIHLRSNSWEEKKNPPHQPSPSQPSLPLPLVGGAGSLPLEVAGAESSPEGQSLPLETCRWRSRVCFGLTTPRTRANFVWGAKKGKQSSGSLKERAPRPGRKGLSGGITWYSLGLPAGR